MSQTVKPGYKQTEVGVIPEDWEVKTLRNVLKKGRLGGNYSNQDRETEFPLMKMGNLGRGAMDTSKVEYITRGVIPEQQHKLAKGDVLFNTRNTLDLVGKVAIWRDELPSAYYNSNLMRLEFDPKEVCTNEYANAALNTSGAITVLRGLATGTTSVAAIYTRDLMDMPFITPPLPEQRAIATALSDGDALLAALDRLIAKQRDLKQAAMQQLLTGQTRLPGFTGKWETKRLGELASLSKGSQLHSSEMDDAGNFAHLNGGITPSGYTHKSNTLANTIAISEGGNSCGFVQFMTEPYWCGGHCYSVIPNGIDNRYLYHALKGQQSGIMALRVGSGLPNVQKTALLAFSLPVPADLPEQTAIATVLSDMDLELAALEQRRDKTRALKQGMMQELLTGRTRLV
jgi:type I restriction enzyme S subunit